MNIFKKRLKTLIDERNAREWEAEIELNMYLNGQELDIVFLDNQEGDFWMKKTYSL